MTSPKRHAASNYRSLDLGRLPSAVINHVLRAHLEEGVVRLSAAAHRHIAEDHPEDYEICMNALRKGALQAPNYIGEDPTRSGNFVIVKRLPQADRRAMLVAIGLTPDRAGDYRVRSCYLISEEKVEDRRRAGRLHLR